MLLHRIKVFLIAYTLIIQIGPFYHQPKVEMVKLDSYTESKIIPPTKMYKVLNYTFPEIPEPIIEPEISVREKVEELISKGKYILTGYCSKNGQFGGRTAKGLPPGIELEGDKIPSVIALGNFVMMDGVRYKVNEDGVLEEYPYIEQYVGKYVECKDKKCNGTHDLFLVRR